MDNIKLVNKLLAASNIASLNISPFTTMYIERLIYNIATYVDSSISVGEITITSEYNLENELSQNIIGIPGAYSCIDATPIVLSKFAKHYSGFEIDEFNFLAKEAIVDFLNLANGLFVVYLSKNNLYELSLEVPKQNGNHSIDNNNCKSITIIPISFSFGNINFLLCEI